MRVVHHHQERLPRLHPLEAAGHGGDAGEDAPDAGRFHPEGEPDPDRAQEVHHVVLAHQRRRDRDGALGPRDLQADAVHARLPACRVELGGWPQAEGEDPHARIRGRRAHHRGAGGVVHVHHRGPARLRAGGQPREEPGLRVAIGVDRLVEVEVVLSEVGEDGHVELDAVDAREGQRVRGHLHRHAAHAGLDHPREERLQLERFRRGLSRVLRLRAHPVLDGADHPGGPAVRAQQRLHQQRGGGLAVGPGDADHGEPPGRMPVIGVREPRERFARRPHHHAHGRAARQRVFALRHHHRGAAVERVGREAAPVLLEAGDGHEQRARRGLARVVGEPGHPLRRRPDHRLVRQRVEEHGGRHRPAAHARSLPARTRARWLTDGSSPRSPRRWRAGRSRGSGAAGRGCRRGAARRGAAAGWPPRPAR